MRRAPRRSRADSRRGPTASRSARRSRRATGSRRAYRSARRRPRPRSRHAPSRRGTGPCRTAGRRASPSPSRGPRRSFLGRRVRASCCRAGSRRERSSVPATPEARRAAAGRARRSQAAHASSIAPTARPTGAPAVRGTRRDGRSRRGRPRRSRPPWISTSTSTKASEQRRASSWLSSAISAGVRRIRPSTFSIT